jgi:acyl-coenzyme A synthetase/AMP-(fatty) acid ligase
LNRLLMQVEGVEDGIFAAPEDLESNPAARLTAYVVAPGRSADQILQGLRVRGLDAVFLPRPVVLVPALPRNRMGKLTRDALESMRTAAAVATSAGGGAAIVGA